MKKVSVIFGTRPEAVKLCPVVLKLREDTQFSVHVCVTGQHRELLDQVLDVFGVRPDVDFELMRPNQDLSDLTARAITALSGYFRGERPDMALVQGDTTTVFAASLAAFYNRVRIGHVEAGLRTWNKHSPFPEEVNRVLTSHLADYHFAPTEQARQNLLKEGIPSERVFVTGNTVIDALQLAVSKVRDEKITAPGLPASLWNEGRGRPLVLITGHRRENFGAGFEAICRAVAELSRRFKEAAFVYPVHLNPNVREPVFRILSGQENVYLLEPLPYLNFVALMERSTLILTDSGGVQEEAPSLGKPVLVMRDTTERPEAVAAGAARLVGTDADKIIAGVSTLLSDAAAYREMANKLNPYGDGNASVRILERLSENL